VFDKMSAFVSSWCVAEGWQDPVFCPFLAVCCVLEVRSGQS
jgi:hypothetical protein